MKLVYLLLSPTHNTQLVTTDSFDVPVAGAFPPIYYVMGSEHALMAVMRGTAVSLTLLLLSQLFPTLLYPTPFALSDLTHHLYRMQSLVELEHSDATIVSVSVPLVVVMGHVTALTAVMRLDVVSGSCLKLRCIFISYLVLYASQEFNL